MLERFHSICDSCGSQGIEYEMHTHSCGYCGKDICEDCFTAICSIDLEGNLFAHDMGYCECH